MSRIRVLHLSRGREWRGGERQVCLLARTQRAGHEVDPAVLTAGGSALATALIPAAVPTLPVPWRWALDPRAAWAALGAVRAWQRAAPGPALLHAHDSHALQLGLLLARLGRLPLVATRRSDTPAGALWRRAGRVIALSPAVQRRLLVAGVAGDRVAVVPTAVDLEALMQRPAPPGPPGPDLVAVGALTPEKGQATLLDAFALVARRIPAARLTILGDGPERAALAERAARLGLTAAVTWLGEVPDATGWIRGAALLVHPSRREALGTAVLEAMALGVPVVASATGGLVDLLGDDHGRLVPPGDPVALSAAILDLLAAPETAARLARRARERVREHDAARVAARTAAVYRSALIQP